MRYLALFLLTQLWAVKADKLEVSVFLGKDKAALHKGEMDYPFGVEFDSKNNMYIVEYDGSRIDVLDNQGNFKVLGGDGSRSFKGAVGPISQATFNGLHNVIIDDNDLVYVTDTFNHCVRRYNPQTGKIDIFVGLGGNKGFNGDGGPASQAKFNELYCIAYNAAKSQMVIADLKNARVRTVDLNSMIVKTVAGNGKKGIPKDGSDALKSPQVAPRAVAVDSKNNIYIADRNGHALRVLRPDGKIYTLVNKGGKKGRRLGKGAQAQLYGPKYVAIDKNDKVYIADDQNHRICKYDPETDELSAILGQDSPQSDIVLKRPHGITFHRDGTLYVVDSGHDRILKVIFK